MGPNAANVCESWAANNLVSLGRRTSVSLGRRTSVSLGQGHGSSCATASRWHLRRWRRASSFSDARQLPVHARDGDDVGGDDEDAVEHMDRQVEDLIRVRVGVRLGLGLGVQEAGSGVQGVG